MNAEEKEPIETEALPQPLSPHQELFQRVKKMYGDGKSIRAIATELNISRITVRRYTLLNELPKKKGHKTTNLSTYNEYLQKRMLEDKYVEVLQLFKEIKALGY